MHLTRAIIAAAVGLAACAEPPELTSTESADQTRAVIYVRGAASAEGNPGNDVTGDGSVGAPYLTLRRAIADVPLELANTRYVIDCTGADLQEVGPSGLALPPFRSTQGVVSVPGVGTEGALTLRADLRALTAADVAPAPASELINAGDVGVWSTDRSHGLAAVRVSSPDPTDPDRLIPKAWAPDRWKGTYLTGGPGQVAIVIGNTADTLTLATARTLDQPLRFARTTCEVRNSSGGASDPTILARGMTGALVVSGLRVTVANTYSVGLQVDAAAMVRVRASELDGMWVQSGSPTVASARIRGHVAMPPWPSKNVGRHLRRTGGTYSITDSFLEDVQFFHGGTTNLSGSIQIATSVLDRCAHIGENVAEEGYSGNWEIQHSWLRGTRGHGFAAPAAQRSYLFHVRIDDAVGDAITADGPGYLALMHVTGSGNAGYGLRAINGGTARITDPPDRTLVRGARGDLQVGARPARSWLGFRTEAPAYSEADFAPDTGDGSRVWEEPSCCGLWTVWGQGDHHEFVSNHAVAIGARGDVVVGGQTASSTLTFAGEVALPTGGGWDGFVIKRGPTGVARWAKRFAEVVTAVAVITADPSDRVVVVGSYVGATDLGGGALPVLGGYDAMVVMLDADGRHLWSTGFGTTGYDRPAAVAVDPAGDVLVVHNSDWNPYGTTGAMTLTKLAGATGAILWQKAVPGVGGSAGFDVAAGADGDVYLVGSFGNPGGGSLDLGGVTLTSTWFRRGFVARLAGATGAARWAQAIDNSTHSDLSAVAVAGDAVFVGGTSRGPATLAGGPPVAVGGEYDVFLARLTAASGAHVWSRAHGGVGHEAANDLALDPDGAVVATGALGTAGVDFGGGALGFTPSPADLVVARYDQRTGAYRAAISRGGSGDDVGVGVAVDPRTRNVVVAGYASGGFDVGDGWGGDALGAYGVFVTNLGRL